MTAVPPAFPRLHKKGPSGKLNPLLHADEAQTAAPGIFPLQFFLRKACPVIPDLKGKGAAGFFKANQNAIGPAVPDDIVHGLLQHAENDNLQGSGHLIFPRCQVLFDGNGRIEDLKLPAEPADGCHNAQIINK